MLRKEMMRREFLILDEVIVQNCSALAMKVLQPFKNEIIILLNVKYIRSYNNNQVHIYTQVTYL